MQKNTRNDFFKIGEVARKTGISIRTLHFYHKIGLLVPFIRTPAGHRIYTGKELNRLLQVKSLQSLGFSLKRIQQVLENPDVRTEAILHEQLDHLDQQIERQLRLRHRLESLINLQRRSRQAKVADLLKLIKEIVRMDKHYTSEQLEQLRLRRQKIGNDAIQAAERDWAHLFQRYREEMEKGTSPSDPVVLELARRSQNLIHAFTGGDPGISNSLHNMYQQESGPELLSRHGLSVDSGVWDFMGKAMRALREQEKTP